MTFTIRLLSVAQVADLWPQLVRLLQEAVDAGASIGFLPPMAADEAAAYWQTVMETLRTPHRLLWVAEQGDRVVGCVQLELVAKPNAPHRAEVFKLMVAPSARRQGIGRALMQTLEERAKALGRTTLVLDTRQGDVSEQLYRGLGYVCVGEIPQYVISENGEMSATVFYYKLI